jgi:hypothetical protein
MKGEAEEDREDDKTEIGREMLSSASKWVAWSIIVGLNLFMFSILRLIAHATVWAFAVPYLVTFVLPVPLLFLIAWWLRKWELRGPPPRLLAFCWGLAMAVFAGGINFGMFYYGAKFGVFHPDLGGLIFVVGFSALIAIVGVYFQMLPKITARARSNPI